LVVDGSDLAKSVVRRRRIRQSLLSILKGPASIVTPAGFEGESGLSREFVDECGRYSMTCAGS
jgi:hypothetical protein